MYGQQTGCISNRSEKSSTGHKGSALAIAAEYKRRREAGQISPSEAARAARMTKRINAPDYKPSKHRKMEVCAYCGSEEPLHPYAHQCLKGGAICVSEIRGE